MKTNIINANGDDETTGQNTTNNELLLTDTNNYTLTKENQKILLYDNLLTDTSVIKPLSKPIEDCLIPGKKKNSNERKKFNLAAGISIQQLVRLHDNLVYPSDGNNISSIADYIPSVYIRLYNRKKWFIQSEFKYAAPQDIQEFIYKVNVQDQPFKDIVTSYTLKQVRFHQISAGFHYFVLPNLSIGSGVIYNIFSSADIQEDVHQMQYESNSLLVGSVNMTNKNDSNFSGHIKNNFQWLLETQYKWKQFSLGLRYAVGLQPYINYVDPFSGYAAQKNNNTLNVFLRYEFWRSVKK